MNTSYDIVCLSHLRWDFVFQRPHHLLVRHAGRQRVFFVEEPVFGAECPRLEIRESEPGVFVVVAHLQGELPGQVSASTMRELLQGFLREQKVSRYLLWYYTPMAMAYTTQLRPLAVVYDCMDELSAFRGAPAAMREHERALFQAADLVFTGGHSLYEAKHTQHARVYLFPSSVDVGHFVQAREISAAPADQREIARPRAGFYGVIDERLDLDLLKAVADVRPEWQFIMVGPTAKIDPASLPQTPNIHYLGPKPYDELPAYLAGWDVALMPFARNESTRFISPTKTPEYLAAGKPVVSTAIPDVVRLYGERGLVRIADSPDEFVRAMDAALLPAPAEHQAQVDAFLATMSWDRTWQAMQELIEQHIESKSRSPEFATALPSTDPTQAFHRES
jgi:UDP-galactopyranose mutase